MRWLTITVFVCCLTPTLMAHHPEWERMPVTPRIDVIGPLGNNLPPSYRRKYNRPSNLVGRLMYYIAPSSQEAMAWHAAQHRHLYKHHRGRVEQHYFFPKPWEALQLQASEGAYQAAPAGDSAAIHDPIATEPLREELIDSSSDKQAVVEAHAIDL